MTCFEDSDDKKTHKSHLIVYKNRYDFTLQFPGTKESNKAIKRGSASIQIGRQIVRGVKKARDKERK